MNSIFVPGTEAQTQAAQETSVLVFHLLALSWWTMQI